jgi:HK97 family phage major capsid protein
MSTQTRERFEKAVADMSAFAESIKDSSNVEDINQLLKHGEEVDRLQQAHKASEAAGKQLESASRYIAELSDAPAGAVKSLNDIGLIAPNEQPAGMFPGTKSIGEAWVESQQFKSLDTMKVGGTIPESRSFTTETWTFDQKALVTGGSATSAGAAVFNDVYRPITDLLGFRELTVDDLITHGRTTSDAIDYVTITGRTNSAGMFAETTNVTSSAIKPESSISLAVQTANVRTIAHWIPITRRAAADAPQVVTLVNAFLRRGLEEKLEDQELNGAGTGEEFTGLLNVSGIQTQDATVGGGGNTFDSIALAISKIRYSAPYGRPTGIVVNPLDWFSTDWLLKKEGTSLNTYAFANPGAPFGQGQSLWGLPVVVTPLIAQNTALVGDFRQAIRYEREGISMYMTDSHADFFTRNVLVILAELRSAFVCLVPAAFVKVTNV